MEAEGSSETLVLTNQTARRHVPGIRNLNTHRRENLRPLTRTDLHAQTKAPGRNAHLRP
jgi:hypothetical protein